MSVLAAERIKLTSTKSPWWCTVIIVALGLGIGAVIGITAKSTVTTVQNDIAAGNDPGFEPYLPTLADAVAGVSGFGVLVLMILAALSITSEYRFGIIRTTFQAIPSRASVLGVKALLIGVFGAVLSLVLTLGAFYIAKATAGPDAGAALVLEGSTRGVPSTVSRSTPSCASSSPWESVRCCDSRPPRSHCCSCGRC